MLRVSVCLLLLLLGGCAPSLNRGNQKLSAALIERSIFVGMTTREDVLAAFGPPSTIGRPWQMSSPFSRPGAGQSPCSQAEERWDYDVETAHGAFALDPRPLTVRSLHVAVCLDREGVVRDYSVSETLR